MNLRFLSSTPSEGQNQSKASGGTAGTYPDVMPPIIPLIVPKWF